MAVHDFSTNALLDPPTNSDAVEVEDNYLICQKSGFRVSVDEGLVTQRDGLKVRRESLDQRHPQDRVRAVPERGRKGSQSPETPDVFVDDPTASTSTYLTLASGDILTFVNGDIFVLAS